MQTRTWLVKFRNAKGYNHEQTAELSGISRAYYTQIENGVRNPSPVVTKAIAEVLNFDWTLFLEIIVAICD